MSTRSPRADALGWMYVAPPGLSMPNQKLKLISFIHSANTGAQPYTNASPRFICTSLTIFRTNAEESSFRQMSSTLSFSATM